MTSNSPVLNGVSRLNSQLIGDMEVAEDAVLEGEALLSAERLGITAEDIELFKARRAVGRFVGSQISGYVIGQTVQNGTVMNKAMAELERKLAEAKNPELVIRISDAIARLNASMMATTAVQLKAVEIMAQGNKKKNRQSNAPQMIKGTYIQAEQVQVNGKP
jgi:hypothetical protein